MVNIAQQQVLCIFFFCACIIGIKLFKLHKLQKGVNSLDQLICVGKTKMYKLRISRLDLTLTTRSSLVSGYPPFCSESPQGTNTSITFSGHITIKILELEFRETWVTELCLRLIGLFCFRNIQKSHELERDSDLPTWNANFRQCKEPDR